MKFGNSNNLDSKKNIVIVIGNEKGGAGKTTTAMHTIASLLSLGFKVASIDVDSRQKSLTRYIENREYTNKKTNSLLMPNHFLIPPVNDENQDARHKEEERLFLEALNKASEECDFIVIDTPGNNTYLSTLAHSHADVIVTPINDSFIDLDVLAKVNPDNLSIERPTHYSEMVWGQKMRRASVAQESIEWIVLRNRLSNIDAKNKRNMTEVLNKLSARVGFKHIPGFSERVIFRELFLQGLTLLDLAAQNISMTMSHIAARQELRAFLKNLNLKKVNEALNNSNLLASRHVNEIEQEELA
ncbi:MAG: AAA family ATPase [Sphingobacteriia bacterium]|nr:AAA family ATPase [Sphingobacteriia bacterium]